MGAVAGFEVLTALTVKVTYVLGCDAVWADKVHVQERGCGRCGRG
jgi:hypothetical protein